MMICKIFTPSLLFVFFLAGVLHGADIQVGRIQSFSGEVLIDAFGNGSFIEAVKGETLYRKSVLKTGEEGIARIIINEMEHEIPPGSNICISEILDSETKKGSFRWLKSLMDFVSEVTSASLVREEEVEAGGRGTGFDDEMASMEWDIVPDDDESFFKSARTSIESENYSEALTFLSKIEDTDSDIFRVGEVCFWRGLCYYELGNYRDAVKYHSQAIKKNEGNRDFDEQPFYGVLLFQLASSYYFLGQDSRVVSHLERLLAKGAPPEYEPYSYLFLISALKNMGKESEAQEYLELTRDKYKGTSYEKEFSALHIE